MRKEEEAVVGKRSRRSSLEKTAMVERWCESGLSRAEFCRREGICYGSFLGWIARWTDEEEAAAQVPEFVKVVEAVPERSRSDDLSGGIELVAPNDWQVRVRSGFESRDLERVVEVLGRC